MKQILNNPIVVPIEISLIEDIIKIIGQAIHTKFSHNEVMTVQQHLINKTQTVLQEHQNKLGEVKDAT